MDILTGLNQNQKTAVEHIDGPCLVIAGAGSGKTKVLTTRIANLIQNGIYSNHILAITFTNKAAREMKERLQGIVGDNDAFVGTFHSFGLRIIKENLDQVGLKRNFTILDSDDVLSVIRKILKDLDYDSKTYSPGFIRNKISFIKNEMLSRSEVDKFFKDSLEIVAKEVYYEYEKYLRKNNTVDFDDLLKIPVELFRDNPHILDYYQDRYRYILVDEYQDTNEVQYKLIGMLARKYRNLFVVGDANQCLDQDTIIHTNHGDKKISDVALNDLVLTGVGKGGVDYQRVSNILVRDYEGLMLMLTLDNKKKLKLTPNHICFYKENSYQELENDNIYVNYLAGNMAHNYHAHRLLFKKDIKEYTNALDIEDAALNIATLNPKIKITYSINLDNGNYQFIKAEDLKEGMILPVFENNQIRESKIINIKSEETKTQVYDLTIPTTRNFLANDICVHNCIYAFRLANYKNILNFEADYPDALVITLDQNYRSTTTILNAANDVIQNNKERKDMHLFSELGEGLKIQYMRAFDEKQEVNLIIEEIDKLLNDGYDYKDIAILYRTNGQARILEEGMLKKNYPYKVTGSYYFYKRKEIKDLLCYLRLISNHDDDVSLKRVINEPKRGIGSKSIEELEKEADKQNTSLFNVLSKPKELEFKNLILELSKDAENLNLTELIDAVLAKTKIKEELEREHTLEADLRLENLMEFRSVTENYQNETGTVNLEDFLDEISLVADISEHQEVDDALSLMTIHSAKGLEFRAVFLAGMEENIMPHSMSLQEENGLEEERRLCYVAITRAKERLYLTNAKRRMLFGSSTTNAPSRFITEISPSLIDKVDHTKEENIKKINNFNFYNTKADVLYKAGDIVNHSMFGRGVVVDADERFVTVAFNKNVGIKKFLSNYQGLRKE